MSPPMLLKKSAVLNITILREMNLTIRDFLICFTTAESIMYASAYGMIRMMQAAMVMAVVTMM